MSQLDNIINKSAELFLRYGLKSLTMDDIARQMGMSKKTIYLYVSNKSDLVKKVMQAHIDQETEFIAQAQQSAKNALEENILMMTYMNKEIEGINASIFLELQKYYPDSYDLFNEHREKVSLRLILNNLKAGIKEGFYRKDIDVEIVGRIHLYALDVLLDQQKIPAKKYSFFEVYKQYINYHLAGIVTAKGAKYLEQSKLLKSLMP